MDEVTIGIGAFFPSLHNRRIAEGALAGLESVISKYPGHRLLAEVFWTYSRFLTAAHSGQLAGAVVYANYYEIAFGLKGTPSARSLGLPLVDTSNRYHEPPLPAVVPDDEQVGRIAARLFRERGCGTAIFVGFPDEFRFSSLRQAGFEAEAGELGLMVLPAMADTVTDRSLENSLAKCAASLPAGTGIFAANDEVAKAVWRALRRAGRRLPEEVLLLGVDNEFALSSHSGGLISSLDPGGFAVGKRAALALIDHILGGVALQREVLSGFEQLHERDSTLHSVNRDPVVARAFRIASPLIPDVRTWAERARVPCRTMERHFRKALGRSPGACLTDWKMERAKYLLLSTDWKMERVAAESGFADVKWFYQAFRKATGRTPGAFREVR